jgi:hypothetical protein
VQVCLRCGWRIDSDEAEARVAAYAEAVRKAYAGSTFTIEGDVPVAIARAMLTIIDTERAVLRAEVERAEMQRADDARLWEERGAHLRKRAFLADGALRALEARFPCDKGCYEAPEEDCSRHGRSPADLWKVIHEVQRQMSDLRTVVADVLTDHAQTVCSDLPNCSCSMAHLWRLEGGR